jgi:hypothetical protein
MLLSETDGRNVSRYVSPWLPGSGGNRPQPGGLMRKGQAPQWHVLWTGTVIVKSFCRKKNGKSRSRELPS